MEFTTAEELLALCGSENITIADVMRRRESTEGELDPQTVEEKMKKALDIMRDSAHKPMRAIGCLLMRNASVAGAEAGCQAEVGSASAMAAAAAVAMFGGSPQQSLDAASIALSNMLGLVCDPIAGLVEAPCQSRNAAGAANALTSAESVLSGIKAVVPFSEMAEAMYKVGKRLAPELRETALGGCAATPTGCAYKCSIFGCK